MITKKLTEIEIFLKKFALLNFYEQAITFLICKQIGEKPQQKARLPDTPPDEEPKEKIYLYESKKCKAARQFMRKLQLSTIIPDISRQVQYCKSCLTILLHTAQFLQLVNHYIKAPLLLAKKDLFSRVYFSTV